MNAERINDALIIDEPWISKILRGEKTWELRSTHCHKRGWIGLIRKGSGHVVGVARIVGSRGPLSRAQLEAHVQLHGVPESAIDETRYGYAWELAEAKVLSRPVRYVHPNGAVKWVRLSADVIHDVEAQSGLRLSHPDGAAHNLDTSSERTVRKVDIERTSANDDSRRMDAVASNRRDTVQRTEALLASRSSMEVDAGRSATESSATADELVALPVAGDGTMFGPHCHRGHGYTIGRKGDERTFSDFYEALRALTGMSTPRWRRRNSAGNWGIVNGVRWTRARRDNLDATLARGASSDARHS